MQFTRCRNVLCQIAEERAPITGHWPATSCNPHTYIPHVFVCNTTTLCHLSKQGRSLKPPCSLEAEQKWESHPLRFSLESKVQRIESKSNIPALFSKTTWEFLQQGKRAGCEANEKHHKAAEQTSGSRSNVQVLLRNQDTIQHRYCTS